MINHNLDELVLSSDKILLLQGPIGSFFYDFSIWLKKHNKTVFKINLNGGDEYFYPNTQENTFAYRETLAQFSDYLINFCSKNQINSLVCFGDNRKYHKIAKQVAKDLNLTFWVFEEGYFRPDYITLEKEGVNAYSPIPRHKTFFQDLNDQLTKPLPPEKLASGFMRMAKRAVQYYWQTKIKIKQYPEYCHHRLVNPLYYIKLWSISGIKRLYYYINDYHFGKQVEQGKFDPFFILPLQVYDDSQVKIHSNYSKIADFLSEVLTSFAYYADRSFNLIIKHHPMDRGFIDYGSVIKTFINKYPHLKGRIYYIHDVPMPIFLRRAKGMVTLNSTCGISALLHNKPVKVLGRANYDLEGLTDQQPLDQFWSNPQPPIAEIFSAFHHYHLNKTHINGSFYNKVVLRFPYNQG